MANNQSVKDQLATRKRSAPTTPEQTVEAHMKKMGPRMAEVLPKHMDMDRVSRIALTTIRINPGLLNVLFLLLWGL